ncbi:MAG: hypothetical protein JWQ11_2710 [Rhizobacter sp.]|nr:hypothetical protein [Rhizobacter sp.]
MNTQYFRTHLANARVTSSAWHDFLRLHPGSPGTMTKLQLANWDVAVGLGVESGILVLNRIETDQAFEWVTFRADHEELEQLLESVRLELFKRSLDPLGLEPSGTL